MNNDIHTYFGLSYANYLVLPRTLLQSMPEKWQHAFVTLLEEYDRAFEHVEQAEAYDVYAGRWRHADADNEDRFIPLHDPVPHYDRGRTRIRPQVTVTDNV